MPHKCQPWGFVSLVTARFAPLPATGASYIGVLVGVSVKVGVAMGRLHARMSSRLPLGISGLVGTVGLALKRVKVERLDGPVR